MAVLRINKTKDFTVMSNYHFRDKNISLKAKGLLSQMLSLPEGWDYSIAGLAAINKENETSIKSALNELKKYKYLKVTKLMPDVSPTGRIAYIYDIYEQPYEKQEIEKQGVDFLGVEFLGVENQRQYNTNNKELNNKELNNKKLKKESKKEKKKSFDDLIDEYTSNDELRMELKNHLATRKAKKATLTNRAIELSFKKLDDLTKQYPVNMQDEAKIKIVQKSIENGWIGFFELKENNNTYQQNKSFKTQNKSSGWDYINEEFEKVKPF